MPSDYEQPTYFEKPVIDCSGNINLAYELIKDRYEETCRSSCPLTTQEQNDLKSIASIIRAWEIKG